MQWRGDVLEYGASPGKTVCAGTFEYLEGYVDYLVSSLEIPLPEDERVSYFWLDPEDVSRRCGDGHDGCADGFESVGSSAVNHHELVHNVLHGLEGHDTHWFFNEGVPEVLDPSFFLSDRTHPVSDPREWIPQAHTASSGYDAAGEFSAHLLYRYGPSLVKQFLIMGDTDDGLDEIRAVFRTVFGDEFDSVAEAFVEERVCSDEGYPLVPYLCTGPTVPWSEESWTYSSSMPCDGDAIAGGEAERFTVVTIEIPDQASYSITSAGGITTLGSCAGCPWTTPTVVAKDRMVERTLDAGLYFVHIRGKQLSSVTVARASAP